MARVQPMLPILNRRIVAEVRAHLPPEVKACANGRGKAPRLTLPVPKRAVHFADPPEVASASPGHDAPETVALSVAPSPTCSDVEVAEADATGPSRTHVALTIAPTPTALSCVSVDGASEDFYSANSSYFSDPNYVAIQVGTSPKCSPSCDDACFVGT
ncbi:unnamed protein product [Effrenium voratum]|nr:unnamed protein product [Effrenium voratum]